MRPTLVADGDGPSRGRRPVRRPGPGGPAVRPTSAPGQASWGADDRRSDDHREVPWNPYAS